MSDELLNDLPIDAEQKKYEPNDFIIRSVWYYCILQFEYLHKILEQPANIFEVTSKW